MSGSTFLVWLFLAVVMATIICPIAAGLRAEKLRSHYNQLWYIPIWAVLAATWIVLAIQIKTDPSLGWFKGGELDANGFSGPQWFAVANTLGVYLAVVALIGFVIPLGKYSTEK